MSILAWFILGLVAGLITGKVYKHSANALALDALLGAIGAIGGGLAFSSFGASQITTFNVYSWSGALAGAVAVLAGHRTIFRRV